MNFDAPPCPSRLRREDRGRMGVQWVAGLGMKDRQRIFLYLFLYLTHFFLILAIGLGVTVSHTVATKQLHWCTWIFLLRQEVINLSLVLLYCVNVKHWSLLFPLSDEEDVVLSPASVTTAFQDCVFLWTVQVNTRVMLATSEEESLCNCCKMNNEKALSCSCRSGRQQRLCKSILLGAFYIFESSIWIMSWKVLFCGWRS